MLHTIEVSVYLCEALIDYENVSCLKIAEHLEQDVHEVEDLAEGET
jgi:hypothetical protein